MERPIFKFNKETIAIFLIITVCVITLVVYSFVTAVVDGSSNPDYQNTSDIGQLNFVFKNCTTLITQATSEKLVLNNKSIDLKTWHMPRNIKKYDLVTLDQQQINRNLRSPSPSLSILIRGIEYQAKLERVDWDTVDDGIDSYTGSLAGETNSSVGITVNNNATIGGVTLKGETFYFGPVEAVPKDILHGGVILHYIYSSKDMKPVAFLIDNGTVSPSPR